jgi:hypothetical protein
VADPFELGQEGRKQGEAARGRFARFPNRPMQCSVPQKEISKRGLMMTISAMVVCRDERTNSLARKYGRFGPLGLPRFDPPL